MQFELIIKFSEDQLKALAMYVDELAQQRARSLLKSNATKSKARRRR